MGIYKYSLWALFIIDTYQILKKKKETLQAPKNIAYILSIHDI